MSSRDWNVPIDLMEHYRRLMQSPCDMILPIGAQLPVSPDTAIEALRHMRDTTQSRDQYNRAVRALKAMGVSDE